jgi:hypothetical protein
MNHTLGDLIIVHLYSTPGGSTSYSINNTSGYTWKTTSVRVFTGEEVQTIWYSLAPANASGDVITVAYTGTNPQPTTLGVDCVQYQGANQTLTSVLDGSDNVFKNASTTTSTMTTATLTTTGTNDMIYLACADASTGGSTWTASGSWAFITGTLNTTFANNTANQLNIGTGGSPYTPTMNGTGTNDWQCIAAAFIAATSGSVTAQSQAIYAAANIANAVAGNIVTVTWNPSTPAGLQINGIEYSGIATSGIVDGTSAGATGLGTSPASGTVTTSYGNDLLFGATQSLSMISNVSSLFTERFLGNNASHDGEDQFPVGPNTYNFQPTLSTSSNWIAQLVALKGSNPNLPPPTRYSLSITGAGLGSGTIVSSVGGINCSISGGITSGVCSVLINKGTPVILTATAGNGSSFNGYTGGGCSTNPSCNLTLNGNTSISAAFNLGAVVFTELNPPPATWYPYPTTPGQFNQTGPLYNTLIPARVRNTLAGLGTPTGFCFNNDCNYSVKNAQYTFSNNGACTETSSPGSGCWGDYIGVTNGSADASIPIYYSNPASDLYYSISGTGGVKTVFQCPAGATFSGSTADQNIVCYDQAQQQVVGIYKAGGGLGYNIGPCPTGSFTGTYTNPCPANNGNGNIGIARIGIDPSYHDGTTWDINTYIFGGLYDNMGSSPLAQTIRFQELLSGFIGHAVGPGFPCSNHSSYAINNFPGNGAVNLQCPTQPSPPNYLPVFAGMYTFDYTDTQLQTICAAIATWKCAIITAITHYGLYPNATADGISPSRGLAFGLVDYAQESLQAYSHLGIPFSQSPMPALFNQGGWASGAMTSYTSGNQFGFVIDSLVPLIANPNNTTGTDIEGRSCSIGCGPSGHFILLNSCVSLSMAGLSGGC